MKLLLTLLAAVSLFAVAAEAAGPPADLYPDHAAVLAAHVDAHGMVQYAALHREHARLDRFLERLASLDRTDVDSWPVNDRIALYVNAYNAFTLKAVVDRYPIQPGLFTSLLYPKSSIRQISGVWDELEWTLAGRRLTLEQIEHEILRKRFNEPRIHMALVCAAHGCPPLRSEPYEGARLDEQLEDQARKFFADPLKLRIDRGAAVVYISPILKWFGTDFVARYGSRPITGLGKTESAAAEFAAEHVDPSRAAYLRTGGYGIEYLDYDWSLNEQ